MRYTRLRRDCRWPNCFPRKKPTARLSPLPRRRRRPSAELINVWFTAQTDIREFWKDFKKKNNYYKYLDTGLLQIKIDKKIDLIKYKLSRLDLKDVNKELEKILDVLK